MAEITKTILLDETGQAIVRELGRIAGSFNAGIADAPADGRRYVRQNGNWVEATDGGAGERVETETVQIRVTSMVEGVSVAGLGLNVFLNGSTVDPKTVVTDEDGLCAFSVPVDYSYRIVFPDIEGCEAPDVIQHVASMKMRQILVNLEPAVEQMEQVKVTCYLWHQQDRQKLAGVGGTVRYGGNSQDVVSDENGELSFYVPVGVQYTLVMQEYADKHVYGSRYERTYKAEMSFRSIVYEYHDVVSGVYVVDDDGTDFLLSDWIASGRSNDRANMIKIVDSSLAANDAIFGISIDDIAYGVLPSMQWSSSAVQFNAYPNGYSYRGKERTALLIEEGVSRSITTPAASHCYGKKREVGGVVLQGFLPSVNQLLSANNARTDIDEILAVVRPKAENNWTSRMGTAKWSADQYNTNYAYYVTSVVAYNNKYNTYGVLAFYAF